VNASRPDRVALLVTALIGVIFAAVLVRVAQLQHAPGPQLAPHVTDRARSIGLDAPRGSVADRRGRLLASSRTGHRLFLDPLRFPVPADEAIDALARASGYGASTIAERLEPALEENRRRRLTGETPLRFLPVGGIPPRPPPGGAGGRGPAALASRRGFRDDPVRWLPALADDPRESVP